MGGEGRHYVVAVLETQTLCLNSSIPEETRVSRARVVI